FDTVKEVSDPRQDSPAKTEEAVEKEAAAPKETTVDSTKPAVAKKPQTGWLQKIGVDLNVLKKETIAFMKSSVESIAVSTMQTALSFTTTSFFVAIFVIFLLAGRDPHTVVKNVIYWEIEQKIRSYISTKLILSLVTATLVGITLSLFGLELALVFAILTFLLNFIPSIGSVIATLLPIPVAFAQFSDNPWTIAGVILIPGAIQMVIGNGIEPKLMGEGLQLHPVTVLLALSFWTLLWGPIGAILAVPITAGIRIVLMRFESGKTAGNLLAGILPGESSLVT
ncbi:MAG: AI-2E family transporter, partial [Gimesia sp.]|nr:AI-2E family transporter [Gimesia sp.]